MKSFLRFFSGLRKANAVPCLFGFFLFAGFAQTVFGYDYVVNTLADSGDGTLRSAVTAATDGQTIGFSVSGTITLTGGQMTVAKSITIDGGGNITIDGNAASRIFTFDGTGTQTITLRGLKLQNGKQSADNAGAIWIKDGTANIEQCTFANNSVTGTKRGGAIYSAGILHITDSSFYGNSCDDDGGAIFYVMGVGTTCTVKNSSFYNNTATDQGGAAYVDNATLNIYNSTVYGNHGDATDGEQFQVASDATLNAYSCIIAGGTLDIEVTAGGVANLSYCLYDSGKVSGTLASATSCVDLVGGSPLLGAIGANGGITPTCRLLPGSPAIDKGSNPLALTTDQRGTGFPRVVGGLTDIGAYEVDPTAPLLNYAGTVFTESVRDDGSVVGKTTITLYNDTFAGDVVSAGRVSASNVPAGLTAVFTRVSDSVITLAFSQTATSHGVANSVSNLTISFTDAAFANSTAGEVGDSVRSDLNIAFLDPLWVTNANDSGAGSLRQTIADAPGGSLVRFDSGVSTITLTGGEIAFAKNLMISDNEGNIVIDGNQNGRIFNIASGSVVLNGLTLQNARSETTDVNTAGGAILSNASLTVQHCRFLDNSVYVVITGTSHARAEGGAICASGGSLAVENSTFEGNSGSGGFVNGKNAPGFGGAIHIKGSANGVILGSTFSNNRAESVALGVGDGAAVYFDSIGTLDIVNSTVSGNTNGRYGSVMIADGTASIYNSTIVYNTTPANDAGGLQTGGNAIVKVYSSIILHNGRDIEHGAGATLYLFGCLYDALQYWVKIGSTLVADADCINASSAEVSALANNGGATQTHALLPQSLAVDAGTLDYAIAGGFSLDYDQRGAGFSRNFGNAPDIGAFELQTLLPEMVVARSGVVIADGATHAIVGTASGQERQIQCTVQNIGTAALGVTTPISVSGTTNCSASASVQPGNSVNAGEETSFTIAFTPVSAGAWSFEVAITNNDANENPYNLLFNGTADAVAASEIEVKKGSVEVADGGIDVNDGFAPGQVSLLSYTLRNRGSAPLTLGAPSLSNSVACSVSVQTAPAASVASEGETTLTLAVTPSGSGDWSFDLAFTTNDADESPWNVVVKGFAHNAVDLDFQQGSASFAGMMDTYNLGTSATTNYAGEPTLKVRNDSQYYSFAEWDVSSVPSNAVLLSAEVTFYQADFAIGTLNLHEMNREWLDTELDFVSYNSGQKWEEPGALSPADRYPDVLASAALPVQVGGSISFQLAGAALDYVQSWIGNPSANKGFKLESTDANEVVDLYSSDYGTAALRPTLTLSYTTSPLPEMEVERAGTPVPDGSVDPATTIEGFSGTLTYRIDNIGTANLILGNFAVSNRVNCSVNIGSQPAGTIAPSGFSELVLTVTPTNEGEWSFDIAASGNDISERDYGWTVRSDFIKPEISVLRNDAVVGIGSTNTVSNTGGGYAKQVIYEIRNEGSMALGIHWPLSITAQSNCNVEIAAQPQASIGAKSSTYLVLTITPTTGGAWSFGVGIGNEDGDENPYSWTVGGTASTATTSPNQEIAVTQGAANIVSGSGSVNFGSVEAVWEDDTVEKLFLIENLGQVQSLSLTGTPRVAVSGANAGDFTVSVEPDASVSPYGSTWFKLAFNPSAKGVRTATVTIANNDSDEEAFSFTVTGTGVERPLRLLWAGNSFMSGGTGQFQQMHIAMDIAVIKGHPHPLFDDHNGAGACITDHRYGRDPATDPAVGSTIMEPMYYMESGLKKGIIYESPVVAGGNKWDALIISSRSVGASNFFSPVDPRLNDGNQLDVPDMQNEEAMLADYPAIYQWMKTHSPNVKMIPYNAWPSPSVTYPDIYPGTYLNDEHAGWSLSFTYERVNLLLNEQFGAGSSRCNRIPEGYRMLGFNATKNGLYRWIDSLNIDKHASSRGEMLGGMITFISIYQEPVPLYAENPALVDALLALSTESPEANEDPLTSADWDAHALVANKVFGFGVPSIVFDRDSVTVGEGGTATFQVRLSQAPASDVAVTVAKRFEHVNNSVEKAPTSTITISGGSSLTFTTANWNDWQTVTLQADEDDSNTVNGACLIAATVADNSCAIGRLIAFETDNDGVQPPASAYNTWKTANGLNETTGAPSADPDGDGVVNLSEYFFGMNPASSDQGELPSCVTETIEGTNYLTITYRKNLAATDVSYGVESSTDLAAWSPVVGEEVLVGESGGVRTVKVRVAISGTKLFLRLKVTQP